MPPTQKPKRTALSISLPPDLATKLQQEADTRLVNPSLLVERAVRAFLPTLPTMDADGS